MSMVRHGNGLLHGIFARRGQRPSQLPRVRFIYPDFGASTRYRVEHQIEALRLAGIDARGCALDQPAALYDLSHIDLLILYRMPLAPRSGILLALARRLGIPVVFDSDDLVWDIRLRDYEFLDRHYQPAAIQRLLRSMRRTAMLLRHVDALILSTPYLASLATNVTKKPIYVSLNAVSEEMIKRSDASWQNAKPGDRLIRIGYFSGYAKVHDEDLASIGAALATILAQYPNVRLVLCGEVALPQELTAFVGQIERRPHVDWRMLPQEIGRVDINIAPLIDNPQRRSKSAVKYLEAALVRVPTVAVRLEPYTSIAPEEEQILFAQGIAEWQAALIRLIEHAELRQQLGQAAYLHVITQHTTTARAPELANLIQMIDRSNPRKRHGN